MSVPTTWTDRYGREHRERTPDFSSSDHRVARTKSAIEVGITDVTTRDAFLVDALSQPNPIVVRHTNDSRIADWTWVVEAPWARKVLLWTNAFFQHDNPSVMEFARVPDSDFWVYSLRAPSSLRTSYRIAAWEEDAPAPWDTSADRRDTILAAMGAAGRDTRNPHHFRTNDGIDTSVASGPDAIDEPWHNLKTPQELSTVHGVPGCEGVRLYLPVSAPEDLPLVVLFDGEVWQDGLRLPEILDQLTSAGLLPPVAVAFIASGDYETRSAKLGVPCGFVDDLIDKILPTVRQHFPVSASPDRTIVAGQSYGGISALWTLALSAGEVSHAIAQSPSLWRFDLTDALMSEPRWKSAVLHAGTMEYDMLHDAQALVERASADDRIAARTITATGHEAGHDWAHWRANLVSELRSLLARVGIGTNAV